MRKFEQISSRENNLLLQRKQRRQISCSQKEKKNKVNTFLFGHPIVKAPREIDLIGGSNAKCDAFFSLLRDSLEKNPKRLYIDFRITTTLKAMPLLVIYSIIDEAKEEYGVTTIIKIMWSKRKKQVNSIIKLSGQFQEASLREKNMTTAQHLPVIMGDNARANDLSNAFVDYILDKYYPNADAEKELEISSAIQETVDNVGRHAYPDIIDHTRKRWWFSCHRIEDALYIVIYDRGIGIPGSLSENNAVFLSRINALYPDHYKGAINDSIDNDSTIDKLRAWFNRNLSDGQLIRSAMHTDVTSTDLDKHGQGSKSIKGLISDNKDSYLLMFSNYGFYCYSKDREDNDQSVDNTDYQISGTLIQWSI